MPRQAAIQVENNFRGGLVTEASGLNFPENACTETWNCVFSFDGSVQRRLGFDFERAYAEKTIPRIDSAITTYVWRNVSSNGNLTLLVAQVGTALYFYTTTGTNVSDGALATTINLNDYKAQGAPSVGTRECQYSDGNGFLFVTHPFCDPIRIEFDTDTNVATGTAVTLTQRDFEGIDDDLEIDERPKGFGGVERIEARHLYNLLNQGWTKKTLNKRTFNNFIPSNSDVMYLFKNFQGKYKIGDGDNDVDVNSLQRGNSPAPKGHFIFTVWDQDRDEAMNREDGHAARLGHDFDKSTGYYRPSTSCFFAGRVFWSGLNYPDYGSKIYFSQIVERDEQYGQCYQQNDPTSEDAFDLLSADGGVISIPEAGTIYKLFTITGGIAVFATNGIWVILGSTGIGFTAKDYTVSKLTAINAISASSFVDVAGNPAWWNREGIYMLTSDGNSPKIQSLTDQRIKTFYNEIPLASKIHAKGYFNLINNTIQWLYKRTAASDVDEATEYDAVMNFDLLTSAFYPWSLDPDHDVKLHGIFAFDGTSGTLIFDDLVDNNGDTIVDNDGDTVQVYKSIAVPAGQVFKYLVSRRSGNNGIFTVAEGRDVGYKDWNAPYVCSLGLTSHLPSDITAVMVRLLR